MSTQDKLARAISLVKAGDKQAGGQLLGEVLQEDPDNERAWLWLSGVVDPLDERRYCLEQVLRINPTNEAARLGLAALPLSQPEERFVEQVEPEAAPPAEPNAVEAAGAEGAVSQKELTDFVVREMGQHASRNEILYALCQQGGLSWPQAEAFVHDVEITHRRAIARRRGPILVIIGIVTAVAGAALFFYNFPFLREAFRDPATLVLMAPYVLRAVAIQVISMGMVLGGLLGIWRALVPSDEGNLSTEALYGAGQGRHESIDDLIDVGVWLGDGSSHSRRDRRRRIRLL
jgi:hypothetical protein